MNVEVRNHSAGILRQIDKIHRMKAVLGFTLLLALGLARDRAGGEREFITRWTRMQSGRPDRSSRAWFDGWSTASFAGSPECILSPMHGDRWCRLQDKVGIKVSAAGRSVSGTNPEVVDAIVDGLVEAGVSPRNIIVWDKSIEDLLAAGYKKDGGRYVLEGIDPKTGYDQQSQVSAPVLGKLIWGDSKFGDRKGTRFVDLLSSGDQLSSQSFFAKVLTHAK